MPSRDNPKERNSRTPDDPPSDEENTSQQPSAPPRASLPISTLFQPPDPPTGEPREPSRPVYLVEDPPDEWSNHRQAIRNTRPVSQRISDSGPLTSIHLGRTSEAPSSASQTHRLTNGTGPSFSLLQRLSSGNTPVPPRPLPFPNSEPPRRPPPLNLESGHATDAGADPGTPTPTSTTYLRVNAASSSQFNGNSGRRPPTPYPRYDTNLPDQDSANPLSDRAVLDDVQQGIEQILLRTERLEQMCRSAHPDRATNGCANSHRELTNMLERMEGEHRQRMADFQDQIDGEARRASDRFVEETSERAAGVVESARREMVDLVENGGCPCLGRRTSAMSRSRAYPYQVHPSLPDIYYRVDDGNGVSYVGRPQNVFEARNNVTDQSSANVELADTGTLGTSENEGRVATFREEDIAAVGES